VKIWLFTPHYTCGNLHTDNPTLPVRELNSSGTVTATNTDTINGLVSRNTSSGSTFYEFDPQGTVAERLNSTGSCTVSSVADASGGIANSGTVSDPFGYIAQAGYYTDRQTGLILTTFRYYDPSNGRFINRDPIGYAGGINLYDYSLNNWEEKTDPYGLFTGVSTLDPPIVVETDPILEGEGGIVVASGPIEAGGGAVALGGGPEDPIGDAVCIVIIVAGEVAYNCAEHRRHRTKKNHDRHTKHDPDDPERKDGNGRRDYAPPKKAGGGKSPCKRNRGE
jgi:RHS repeat-associated protein